MPKLLNDDRTKPIYATTRFSDVLSYSEGQDFLRVLFDDKKHLFIYCNGWDYIHIFLGKAAIDSGLYPQDMTSKLSKNLGLFEFTISSKYRENLIKQDSYNFVKEFNGFYIYTREGSELLKNPVFKEIVKPYIKKKEITIEQRIRRLEKKLDESTRKIELKNSPKIYEVKSLNDIKALLKKFRFGGRGIYNIDTGHMFICDNEELIHHSLANTISQNIEPVDRYSKFSFYNSYEKALDSEYVSEDVWGYGWDLYTDNEIYVWVCTYDLDGRAYELLTKDMDEVEPFENDNIQIHQLNENSLINRSFVKFYNEPYVICMLNQSMDGTWHFPFEKYISEDTPMPFWARHEFQDKKYVNLSDLNKEEYFDRDFVYILGVIGARGGMTVGIVSRDLNDEELWQDTFAETENENGDIVFSYVLDPSQTYTKDEAYEELKKIQQEQLRAAQQVLIETQFKEGGIIVPEHFKYAEPNDDGSELDESIKNILRISGTQLNEREDLTNFNRIAGFYHLDTKEFELFPRTSEEISPEEDEINDYIHNVSGKDELEEFKIVRFGIEDLGKIICYIESYSKRSAYECKKAIENKFYDVGIQKFEIEYLDNSEFHFDEINA